MGFFFNDDPNILSFAFGGYKFIRDEHYISYKSAYGKTFRVLINDIDSVSIDTGGWGKGVLKLNGKGTLLAEVELPQDWAISAQDFISKLIPKPSINETSQGRNTYLAELERLVSLKDKGHISDDEFQILKKKLIDSK